jgi:hypothetical protein
LIHFYKRGGGDPAPPCVTEAEYGKNARGSHWRWDGHQIKPIFKKYGVKEAVGPQGLKKKMA